MREAKLPKVLSPAIDDEPMITFRAKDDLSIGVVERYKQEVLANDPDEESDMIKSLDEWIERAKEWRAEHPALCQLPTF